MAHTNMRGYALLPHTQPRRVEAYRLETFRLTCDPRSPRFRDDPPWPTREQSLMSDAQLDGADVTYETLCRDYMHVAHVRELLEHIDCLQAQLDTIDQGARALVDPLGDD